MTDAKLHAFMQLLLDLDRCQHGRHAADPCFGCPDGQSAGNQLIPPGTLIGTTVGGRHRIVVPDPAQRYEPSAWIVPTTDELDNVARAAEHSQSLIRVGAAALEWYADVPADHAEQAQAALHSALDNHRRAFPRRP